MLSLLVIASLAGGAGPERPPYLEAVSLRLADGRTVPGYVDRRDLDGGEPSVRFAPDFRGGAFWAFGDALRRQVFVGCPEGSPVVDDGVLGCPAGAPVLRPDVTLPEDPAAHPNSNVPPVRPEGRPVTQSLHFLVPWLLPCGVALLVLLGAGTWLWRRSSRGVFPAPDAAPPPWTRGAWIAAGITSAIGLALRLYGLGHEPFEQNEFTYYMSGLGHDDPLGVILDVNAMAQTHPPLPHLVLWLFGRFGNDEVVARLPSALAGAALVPLMFALAWRLFGGRLAAATAVALLAAVAPVHVWYSQDVSPYALTALFAGVALLSTDGALRDPRRRRPWVGLGLATLGLVYTHYYGLHLAFACFVTLGIRAFRVRSAALALRTVGAGCLTWVGIVPWIPAFVQAYLWSRGHSTAYQRGAGVYHPSVDLGTDLLDVLRLVAGFPWEVRWAALAGAALFVAHLPLPALRGRRTLLLAPLVWFIPFELLNRATFLQRLYDGYYFGVRYFLFLFPVAWLLAGACLARRGPLRWPTWGALALAVGLGGFETGRRLVQPDKPDVATAARLVAKHVADGDAVIVGPAVFYQHPFHYYFASPEARPDLRINDFMQTPAWHDGGWVGVLSDLYEPYERTLQSLHIRRVFVVDHTQHLLDRREFSDRPSEALRAVLAEDFARVWARDLHDVTVTLYERRRQPVPLPEQVHFGWSDQPFVRRFDPAWAYASPGRRVERGAQVRLPAPEEGRISAIRLRMGTMPGGGHQPRDEGPPEPARLRILANGRPVADLLVTGTYQTYEVALPPDIAADLVLTFDRQRPPAGPTRPPWIVLDTLDPVRGPQPAPAGRRNLPPADERK